jgi:proline dehydrogenase
MLSFENTEIAFKNKSDREIKNSIFLFRIMGNAVLTKILTSTTQFLLNIHFPIKFAIKSTIYKQFCGGETIDEAKKVIHEMGKWNVHSILDYSVEGEDNELQFDLTKKELLHVVELAATENFIPVACLKITGIGRFSILEKVSSKKELNEHEKNEFLRLKSRLFEICKSCYDKQVPIYIDAEESWIQPAIDDLVEEMMMQYNHQKAIIFNTIQFYRHDRLAYLNKMIHQAKQNQYMLGIKIVRGAYMEKENERAKKMNYPSPIQPNKEKTDEDYNIALEIITDNINFVEVCCGTHNEKSCLYMCELMQKKNIPNNHPHIYFSQLYGMSDHISFNLAKSGYQVSKYLPYGPIESTMPYLIRRAEENTSIAGQMGKELKLILGEQKRRRTN